MISGKKNIIVTSAIGFILVGVALIVVLVSRPDAQPTASTAYWKIDEAVLQAGRNYSEKKNDGGTVTRSYMMHDTQYRSADGSYQPIDTSIVASAGNKDIFENTKNVVSSYFSKISTSDAFVSITIPGGRTLQFQFTGSSDSTGKTDANTITYLALLPGIDAKYTVTESGLLEQLIVTKEIDPVALEQVLTLHGLLYYQQSDGAVTFHNSDNNHVDLVMSPAIMREFVDDTVLDTQPANLSTDIQYTVTNFGNGQIKISRGVGDLGRQWLKTAHYPISIETRYINPKKYNVSGQLWKYAQSAPDATYGLEWTAIKYKVGTYTYVPLQVCRDCDRTLEFRALLSFPIGNDITTSQIVGATLNAYMHTSGAVDVESAMPENLEIPVSAGVDVWSARDTGAKKWGRYVVMSKQGTVSSAELPKDKPKTTVLCEQSPADCKTEIAIDTRIINPKTVQSSLQIVLDGENVPLDAIGKFSGLYIVASVPSLEPTLEITLKSSSQ